jgi:nucleoside-diphosphate-sugar epimerase
LRCRAGPQQVVPWDNDSKEYSMHVLIFGATGMIGHGVLDACLRDSSVNRVTVVGRRSTGRVHPKLIEHLKEDVSDLSGLGGELGSADACLFCLGVTSAGLDEAR